MSKSVAPNALRYAKPVGFLTESSGASQDDNGRDFLPIVHCIFIRNIYETHSLTGTT